MQKDRLGKNMEKNFLHRPQSLSEGRKGCHPAC